MLDWELSPPPPILRHSFWPNSCYQCMCHTPFYINLLEYKTLISFNSFLTYIFFHFVFCPTYHWLSYGGWCHCITRISSHIGEWWTSPRTFIECEFISTLVSSKGKIGGTKYLCSIQSISKHSHHTQYFDYLIHTLVIYLKIEPTITTCLDKFYEGCYKNDKVFLFTQTSNDGNGDTIGYMVFSIFYHLIIWWNTLLVAFVKSSNSYL